jgi:hypothetical protein
MMIISHDDPVYGFTYSPNEKGSLCPYCKDDHAHISVIDKSIHNHHQVNGKTRVICRFCHTEMNYLDIIKFTMVR